MGLLGKILGKSDSTIVDQPHDPDTYRTHHHLLAYGNMTRLELEGTAASCSIEWTEQGSAEILPGIMRRTPAEYRNYYKVVHSSEQLLAWREGNEDRLRWVSPVAYYVYPSLLNEP